MIHAYMNWSGGKDSSLCLYHVLQQQELDVKCLLTSVNGTYNRISMHGVRVELLEQQAQSIGIPLVKLTTGEMPTMAEYEAAMYEAVTQLTNNGLHHAVFGDIFLEDLKQYRVAQLQKANVEAIFPLWKRPTHTLLKEFIALGFKAILVCVNEKYLDKSFCGRLIDEQLLNDLPLHVDPCGENGEYHSFVFDGPIFKYPIPFEIGEIVHRSYAKQTDADTCGGTTTNYDTGFYYCDLLPVSHTVGC